MIGTSFCLNKQAYVKLIIFSTWQWKNNSRNWFCHSLEANQSLMVDGLVFILLTDSQPLLNGVEEVQDHWRRKFVSFLADFSLERGKGGCLSAFVKDGLLQSRLEIFDWPKGGNARRVDFFGNKLNPLLHEGKGVIFHVELWANGVRGRRGLGQIGLGADGIKGKWIWPAPTWQTTPWTSCNNRSSSFPKEPTLLSLPPLGQSKISGRLWRRPSLTKAVRQPPFPLLREKSARKLTKFLFQWSYTSSTPSRRGWPSVSEMNTRPSTVRLWFAFKEWQNQFLLLFFHCQLPNLISFTYACLFKQKLVPIIHLT